MADPPVTNLLDQALAAARGLPVDAQDDMPVSYSG
jgi:hypothetical protein